MPETQTPNRPPAAAPTDDEHGPSATQLAAVVEAAYILEAVRR
jgi:hypothetical protein